MKKVLAPALTYYIMNQVILTAHKSEPFLYSDILQKIYDSLVPVIDRKSVEAKFVGASSMNNFNIQLESLLRNGYVRRCIEGGPQKYILSELGEKIQSAGGIKQYYREQDRLAKTERTRNRITYIFIPAIGVLGLIGAGASLYSAIKAGQPIDLKQPIRVYIDQSKENNFNNNAPKNHGTDSVNYHNNLNTGKPQ